jgi:hypothetical protein
MGKNIDIDKLICPSVGVLQTENETVTAKILDDELDILECSFNNDMCVEINTQNLTYISLSLENLETLKKLIIKAEKHYQKKLD